MVFTKSKLFCLISIFITLLAFNSADASSYYGGRGVGSNGGSSILSGPVGEMAAMRMAGLGGASDGGDVESKLMARRSSAVKEMMDLVKEEQRLIVAMNDARSGRMTVKNGKEEALVLVSKVQASEMKASLTDSLCVVKDSRDRWQKELENINWAEENKVKYTVGCAFENGMMMGMSSAIMSILQMAVKKSPAILSRTYRLVSRAYDRMLYGVDSFSLDYLIALNNKAFKTVKPLTVQAAGGVLAREKRLRVLDDEQSSQKDPEWSNIANMTQKELSMIVDALKRSMPCYRSSLDEKQSHLKHFIIGASQKVSLARNQEILLYLEMSVEYLELVISACQDVASFEKLDKEYVKKLLIRICDTFEHLGFLIDEEGMISPSGRGAHRFLKLGVQGSGQYNSYGSGSLYGGGGSYAGGY